MGKILTLNQGEKRRKEMAARLIQVRTDINTYHKSIQRLLAFACGKRTLKNKGYAKAAVEYKRTLKDETRLPHTIKNLKFQIALMEKEIQILKEFKD